MKKPSLKSKESRLRWIRYVEILSFCLFSIFLVSLLVKNYDNKRKAVEEKIEEDNDGEESISEGDWGKLCSRHFPYPEKRKLLEDLRIANSRLGCDCDYCKKKIIELKNVQKDQDLFSLTEKHLTECKEAERVFSDINAKKTSDLICDEESSLKKKGYQFRQEAGQTHGSHQDHVMDQIKSWGLINRVNLPNLLEKKRIGVVKVLSINTEERANINEIKVSGSASDHLIFLTPSSTTVTIQNLPSLLEKNNFKFFYPSFSTSIELGVYEKIITVFFIWNSLTKQSNWNYNIFSLPIITNEGNTSIMGESGTVSFYLALLSAYYQKPISREVAASCFLNLGNYLSEFNCCHWCFREEVIKNLEKSFSKHKISPVGELECKVEAAAEAGVKKLILSTEQKENYEKVVPKEIREQLKVYYIANVEELEKLFWEGEFS